MALLCRTRPAGVLVNNVRWLATKGPTPTTLGLEGTLEFSKRVKGTGCPLCRNGLETFGYKDVLLIRQFLTPEGLTIGRKKTGLCKKMQRKLDKTVRMSRNMGLLPKVDLSKRQENDSSSN
ncbi:small ribosomal subunit protein bS18-like [Dysidea avara]|uniref:small ribosomal subunit protein bS18-like n=1 Tax=Dysidea avara TaxID=196820 RepID=UPI003333122E